MAKDKVLADASKEPKDTDIKSGIETDNQEMNPDILEEMFMTNMGEGMLEEKSPDLEDEEDPEVEFKAKKDSVEPLGQYADKVIEDVMANPAKYTVQTSEGEMNLKEAMDEGWDPETDTFDRENSTRKKEEDILGGLGDSDRNAIQQMTSPSNAQFPQGEADQFGLEPGNPLLAGGPGAPGEEEEMDPAMMQAMMGGM